MIKLEPPSRWKNFLSRKFLLALGAAIGIVIVQQTGADPEVVQAITAGVVVLAVAYIGGESVIDAIRAGAAAWAEARRTQEENANGG